MANGRLAGCNPDPSFAPKQARLQEFARKHGVSADAAALAAVIAQPFKPMVLSGACTIDQLRWGCRLSGGFNNVCAQPPGDWTAFENVLLVVTAQVFCLGGATAVANGESISWVMQRSEHGL